jgi:protein O-GlcNAc transferase
LNQGLLDEAEKCYRIALEIEPDTLITKQSILMLMNYSSRYDAQTTFSEHLRFMKNLPAPLSATLVPYNNDRTIDRQLRIGYVSPDFRKQSVGFFIEPVLVSHNHQEFAIFCYANLPVNDEMTQRMKKHATYWRNISGMPDESVSGLIRNDEIDILVDLAGHSGYNRIPVFVQKPAPVQISWIGYPNTTGLSSMDYKIVDYFTDPSGRTEQYYTEKLIRMPDCFLCYLPDNDSPDVGVLPALTNGHITFGSFNSLAKVSPEVVTLWSKILRAVPDSHLIIKRRSLFDKKTCQYFKHHFIEQGIAEERIELLSWTNTFREHLEAYDKIDICLDPFPYNGTTNTCEALWMGVPVITLAGTTHVSRVGLSLLSNIGLPELIASSSERYLDIAVNLADDIVRLQSLRRELRDMMGHSPLTSAEKFTLNLEDYFRQMWAHWCESV